MAGRPATPEARGSRGLFRLWQTHRFLMLAFAAALAFAVFFTVRTALFYAYWHEHRDQPIEPWMTVGYVAHSRRDDKDEILEAIGTEPDERDRRPLGRMADERGIPFDTLAGDVMRAIADARSGDPDTGTRP